MNAHNDAKRPSGQSLDARLLLAAAQLRLGARVDLLVARWFARCATNAEAAQLLFKTDRQPTGAKKEGAMRLSSRPKSSGELFVS